MLQSRLEGLLPSNHHLTRERLGRSAKVADPIHFSEELDVTPTYVL